MCMFVFVFALVLNSAGHVLLPSKYWTTATPAGSKRQAPQCQTICCLGWLSILDPLKAVFSISGPFEGLSGINFAQKHNKTQGKMKSPENAWICVGDALGPPDQLSFGDFYCQM